MSKLIRVTDTLLEKGVVALLIFTPLAFGAVQKWSVSLLEIIAFLLLVILFLKQFLTTQTPAGSCFPPNTARILKRLCLLFAGIVLLQLLPLPLPLLKLISPVSHKIHTLLGSASVEAWRTISISPYATVQDFLLLLSYAAIFTVIISHYRTRTQISGIVTTILIMGGLLVIVAALQKAFWNGRIFWIYPVDDYLVNDNRIWGPYLNRNHFAGYLELAIPLGLGMLLYVVPTSHSLPGTPLGIRMARLLEHPKTTSAAIWFMLLLVMTAGLFASLSRGGISACVASFCLFVLITRKRRSLKNRSLLLVTAALVFSVVVIFASWEQLEDRFEALDTGHVGRLNVWKDSVGLVRDFPLLGSGLGTFETTFRRYQSSDTSAIYDHAHNDYVESITDTGLIGLTLQLLTATIFFAALYFGWRRRQNMYAKCIGAGGISSGFALAVHSFTDFNLHIPANALLFTVIAALTYSVLFNMQDEHADHFGSAQGKHSPLRLRSGLSLKLFTGILLLCALLYLPLAGLISDRRYSEITHILDDKKTEDLDVVALLPETAPIYLEALRTAQSAYDLEPSRPLYNWTIADIASKMGRWVTALEMLKAPIPVSAPSRDLSFGIAQAHLNKMITVEPTSTDAHLAMASLQENWHNNPIAAAASLKRAMEAFPGSAAVRLAVARHHLAAGRTGDTLEQLRLLSKLDDSYLLYESSSKADTLERRPSWYLSMLQRSNLYAALDIAWRITHDPLVVKGLVPEHPEAKNVLQAFLDAKGIE